MSPNSGYYPPPTTARCDNPRCNAIYEVPNLLGGHTFTCNRCGSKVTIRGHSTAATPPKLIPHWILAKKSGSRPSGTTLLDSIVSVHERRRKSITRAAFAVLAIAVVVILVWRWSPAPSRPTPIPTLQDAVASGLVTVEITGIGGSSGDSVKLSVARGANAGSGTVQATLPAGSILVSEDPRAQSMMVATLRGIDLGRNEYQPKSRIVLTGSTVVVYVLAAYCIEFRKENPSPATRFDLRQTNPMLACIAQGASSLTVPATQAAVWMQTDNITYSHMNQKLSVTQQDWDAGQRVFQQCRSAMVVNPIAGQRGGRPL